MYAVAWAFAWDMWGRHRRLLLPSVAYLLGLALLVNALPAGTLGPELVIKLTVPLWVLGPHLLGACSLAEQADLVVRESGYPRRLLTLPLRTLALVAWPMGLGAAALALYWFILGGLILRSADLPVPLLWPAAFAAALLTWSQALIWFPFPLPFLRLFVAVLVVGGMTIGVVLGALCEVAPALLLAVSAGLILPGYLVGVAGVARARRGDTPVWNWPLVRRRTSAAAARPAFASAAAAQFWLEWERNGWALPIMAGLIVLSNLVMMALVGDPGQADWQAGVFLCSLVIFPPMVAAAAGASAGNGHPWKRQVAVMPAFLAARPVTSAEMIAVKLRLAARATLVTWALAYLPILALLPLTPAGGVLARWAGRFLDAQGLGGAFLLLLIILGLPALTAKEFVNQLWIGLTGRTWVMLAVTLTAIAGMMTVGLVDEWLGISSRPELQAALLDAVPWVIVLVLALKLGAGLLVARTLLRRGLVAARTLRRFAVAWVGAAGLLFGLAFWLVPPEVYSPFLAGCAAVVLGLPLVRLGLAPLALEWNRHR
jgi:hypothetical protein